MNKAVDRMIWVIERVVILMLAISVVVIAAQVFWRYVLREPLGWTEQVARYLFVWMIFLGIPITFHKGMTAGFDVLQSVLKHRGAMVLEVIIQLLICGFAVFYFIYSLDLCIITGGRMVAGVIIPQNLIYIVQPISALLLLIVGFNRMLSVFKSQKI